ncbi:MAG: diphosphomevalonate decarboxylase [Coxiellaceae bacterium]|jgi:diphosphomevalonate decarboxylase|nr:diphosphomevalonate decarboxylase [Coxiellaceae bacterium]
MIKIDVVRKILSDTNHGYYVNNHGGSAWASSNVALCKYWGKRNIELNLPVTSSLSISLGYKGTRTTIKHEGNIDRYLVNGKVLNQETKFYVRLKSFLDLFRFKNLNYSVIISTNIPIAAGFASSACGFASLVSALNNLYSWKLSQENLSVLARLGSGSACRSIFDGFVEWQQGERDDGMDSYGRQLAYNWPNLRIGALIISSLEKSLSSREAMERTVNTSPLYLQWPKQAMNDLTNLKLALFEQNFDLLGKTTEKNALTMHAAMAASSPPIIYSLSKTREIMAKIQAIRYSGIQIFFTQDAGPNLQLLFLAKDEKKIISFFPNLEIISPFSDIGIKKIILVDDNDTQIGIDEKIATHIKGQLHRAFSVAILRRRNNCIELLLQKRSWCKYHSSNLWSNTCCGHPAPGDDIAIAAIMRLQYEIGFSVPLKEIGKFHYRANFFETNFIENEIDHVLVGFNDIENPLFNHAEVQDTCWLELATLQRELHDHPNNYTIWLSYVLNLLLTIPY